MPHIFDNIDLHLADGLRNVLPGASACSFCVGYLNLRGWGQLADQIERLPGGSEDRACRLLVGMHRAPEDDMKLLQRARRADDLLNGPTLAPLRRRVTESFKEQPEFGVPSNEAERTPALNRRRSAVDGRRFDQRRVGWSGRAGAGRPAASSSVSSATAVCRTSSTRS
jgi:hypothetical protein